MDYETKIKILVSWYRQLGSGLDTSVKIENTQFQFSDKRIIFIDLRNKRALASLTPSNLWIWEPIVIEISLNDILEDYRQMDYQQFILTHGREPFGDLCFLDTTNVNHLFYETRKYIPNFGDGIL